MSEIEAGDETFVRSAPSQVPPSLDYLCAKCGEPITDWSAKIDPVTSKLKLVARCHGEMAEMTVYLDMRGMLFRPEGD